MTDNQQEIFPITDEAANIRGKITRGEAHSGSRAIHPVVHLHVFNSNGDIYLQQRPLWKDIQPGKWDTAVGGHIDYTECLDKRGNALPSLFSSETFRDISPDTCPHGTPEADSPIMKALRREVREELGITAFTPTYHGTYIFEGAREREQVFVFSTIYDGDISPNSDELSGGRFWTQDELDTAKVDGILTPNFVDEYQKVFG